MALALLGMLLPRRIYIDREDVVIFDSRKPCGSGAFGAHAAAMSASGNRVLR